MSELRKLNLIPPVALILCCYLFSFSDMWFDDVVPIVYVHNAINFPSIKTIVIDLFSYHNEHVLLAVKALFLLVYLTFGVIDLKIITYLSIGLYIFIYFFIKNKFSLSHFQQIILSFGLLMPVFYDILYWAMSIQNILVNLFVLLSWYTLLKKQYFKSNIYIIAAIFSSAQAIIFLPIWCGFAIFKKRIDFKYYVLPIIITAILKLGKDENVTKNPFFNDSFVTNLNLEKLKETFLSFCAPFNFHLTTYQFFISTIMILVIIIVVIDYLKKLHKNTTTILEDFLMGMILYSLGCFLASFLIRQVIEIRYLVYSCIYIPFSIIYLTNKYPNIRLSLFFLVLTGINYLIVIFATAEILPGIYIEKTILAENFNRNHHANFFPTKEIREQTHILSNKKEFKDQKRFEIPNGLNGSIPEHLYAFNQFIGYSRNLIHVPKPNEYILPVIETKTIKLKPIENTSTDKIKEIINLNLKKENFNEYYKLVIYSKEKQYEYFIPENELTKINKNLTIKLYSNQIALGLYQVKLVKLALVYLK